MTLNIKMVDAPLGHEIQGVDLANLSDEEFDQIERAFDQYGVISIRGQRLTPEQHVNFSRRFGGLDRYILDRFNLPSNPFIFVVSNIVENGTAIGMADAGRYWHSDMWSAKAPPRGSIMYAIEVPSSPNGEPLGDTLFASTQAAYDGLPDALKKRITGRKAVYSGDHYVGHRRTATPTVAPGTKEASEARNALAGVEIEHPLVRRHPRTGRNCIYFSEGAIKNIVGMDQAESDELLQQLHEHILRPEFRYRHKWQVGDVVFWDNCSVIHKATSDYELPLRRHMHRTTLSGTVPA
jgi:taurine dioxygenase